MAAKIVKLGPGLLSVGATGTPVDFTCQVTAARVEWAVDEGDTATVLCGEVVPGARTYTASLTATIFSDIGLTPGPGIVEYSWTNKGTQQPFKFTPNTVAAKMVAGTVIVDPISVGGDEAGANMASDFEWAIVGTPTIGPISLEDEALMASEEEAA